MSQSTRRPQSSPPGLDADVHVTHEERWILRERSRVLRIAAGLLLVSGAAVAQDETTEPTSAVAAAPTAATAEAGVATAEHPYEFQGWIDSAIVYNNEDGRLAGRAGFSQAQIGLRVGKAIDDNFGGYAQVNAFFNGARTAGLVAREAYAYAKTKQDGFKFLFGKFYAPIGFELADPPDLYQFTNSLLFSDMTPTELVGAKVAIQLVEAVDLQLYVSGPWDDDAAALTMGTKVLGTRLGFSGDEWGGAGLSVVGGPVASDEGIMRVAIDADAGLTLIEDLLIGLEANVNLYEQRYVDSSGTATSGYAMPIGFLVMGNYAFTDLFNLTLRYDMVIDAPVGTAGELPGAVLFGAGPSGDALTLSSVTVGPNFHLADGWDVFTEIRYDMASDDIYSVGGSAGRGYISGAVEVIFQFL